MCYEFACGDIAKGRLSLGQVLNHGSNAGSNDYASIDSAALEGYCQAFGVRPVNDADPIVAPVTEQTPAILAADNERKLLSMIGRHLIEKATSSTQPSTLYVDVTSENVVRSYHALLGVTNRCLQYLTSIEAHLARFARVIAHQLTTFSSSSGNNRTITAAVVQYLCANVPGMDAALRSQLPSDQLQRSNIRIVDFVQRAIVLTPPPQPGAVAGLLSGGNDLWQLLLSYDSAEIKNLMLRIVPFVVPARFNVSMVLGEEVLTRVAAGPHQEYITVLMSKLEQLAKLGKIGAWQTTVNACGRELGPLGNDTKVQTTFTFEALRIELEAWHERLHQTTDMRKFGLTTAELALKVKGLLQAAMSGRMKLNSELMLLLATFLINTSDWDYIFKKLDGEKLKSPFVDLGRLFAAFAMTVDQGEATTRRVAQSVWQVLLPTMEDSVQIKRAGNATRPVLREQNRNQLLSRRQLVAFSRNVKEQTSVSLLLSLLGKLFNCANGGMNRMFIQHSEYWPTVYDGSNVNNDFLNEMISLTMDNGLLINPNNAFYLRSKGDFLLG
uniref:INTS8 TPR repeats domain-containing protein n=1 Tax=Plectus sambesii TaxID=2011161 RepID=A0A914XKJ6_9BILA